MTVVPFPADKWTWESARGLSRAVRVSPHVEAGLLTISFWRDDRCVGTVRLTPAEAASLVGRLTAALAGLAQPPGAEAARDEPVEDRLAEVERRLRRLEAGAAPADPPTPDRPAASSGASADHPDPDPDARIVG